MTQARAAQHPEPDDDLPPLPSERPIVDRDVPPLPDDAVPELDEVAAPEVSADDIPQLPGQPDQMDHQGDQATGARRP